MSTELAALARMVASQGRAGDTELMHVSPEELRALAALGAISVNPVTGLPEAFKLKSFLPILGAIAAPALLPSLPAALASGIGAGVGALAGGAKPIEALQTGALSGIGQAAISALSGQSGLGVPAEQAPAPVVDLSAPAQAAAAPLAPGVQAPTELLPYDYSADVLAAAQPAGAPAATAEPAMGTAAAPVAESPMSTAALPQTPEAATAASAAPAASAAAQPPAPTPKGFVDQVIAQFRRNALGIGINLAALGLAGAVGQRPVAGMGEIQALGGLGAQTARELITQAQQGRLLPGQEAALQRYADQAKAQIRNYFASIGQFDSTSRLQAERQIDQELEAMRGQLISGILQQGLSAIGAATGPLGAAANVQLQRDIALQRALASFGQGVGAMFGMQAGVPTAAAATATVAPQIAGS